MIFTTIKHLLLSVFCILFFFGFSLEARAGTTTHTVDPHGPTVDEKDEFIDVTVSAGNNTPTGTSHTRTVRIYYRVNQTSIDHNYMDNAHALGVIDSIFVAGMISNDDYIVIAGKASPEGPLANNNRLAERRASTLKNYILQKYPQIKENRIITVSEGENWDGLLEMVKNDADIPYRTELLEILNSGLSRETQKVRMRTLGGGETYRYLSKYTLPFLREGATGVFYLKKSLAVALTDTVEVVRVDTLYVDRIVYLPMDEPAIPEPKKEKKPFYIAVKNNLIYDLGLLPNLAVEVPFGRDYRWSVEVQGNWSWWKKGAPDYWFHRVQIAGGEVRRWFGNRTGDPLHGYFVGAYGYGGTYDFRLFADKNSDLGQLSNRTWSAGLSAGYAMPIGRRFNMEFGLGLGYIGGRYYKYYRSDCEDVSPKKSAHDRNYFGPTKANVSIVWLIGSGVNENYKPKKGKR